MSLDEAKEKDDLGLDETLRAERKEERKREMDLGGSGENQPPIYEDELEDIGFASSDSGPTSSDSDCESDVYFHYVLCVILCS